MANIANISLNSDQYSTFESSNSEWIPPPSIPTAQERKFQIDDLTTWQLGDLDFLTAKSQKEKHQMQRQILFAAASSMSSWHDNPPGEPRKSVTKSCPLIIVLWIGHGILSGKCEEPRCQRSPRANQTGNASSSNDEPDSRVAAFPESEIQNVGLNMDDQGSGKVFFQLFLFFLSLSFLALFVLLNSCNESLAVTWEIQWRPQQRRGQATQ
jgi:hypothetical protein